MGTGELIEKILSDAQARVTAIKAEKVRLVQEIQQRAESEETKLKKEMEERLKQKVEFILERAKSQARLERRKILLEARWRLIDILCERVKEIILNDPDYLMTIRTLAEKYADKESIVYFSAADTPRIGSIPGLKIGEPATISGGLIIRHGREEIDYSLDTVVSQVKEELLPQIARILFSD